MDDCGYGYRDRDADQVHRVGRSHRVVAEEHFGEEYIDGKPRVAAHERRDEHDLVAVALVFKCARGHYRGHGASEAEQHRDERLS